MKRTFTLILIVVVALVGLYFLPQLRVLGVDFRKVDVLADIRPLGWNDPVVWNPDEEDSVETDEFDGCLETYVDSVPDGMIAIEDFRDSLMRHREMDGFYKALNEAGKRVVRIAYFGDSFIEGDIFTANLRELLQEKYGGKGVGFIDIHSAVSGFRRTVRENSSGWRDYSVVDKAHGFNSKLQGLNSRYYVPEGNSARICVEGQRSVFPEHLDTVTTAILYYTPGKELDMLAEVNDEPVKVVYGRKVVSAAKQKPTVKKKKRGANAKALPKLSAKKNVDLPDSCADSCMLAEKTDSVHPPFTVQTAVINGRIGRLTVDVKGEGRFYGLALENRKGIIVDNFSMRGSMGWHLGSIPVETLKAFAQLRDYDLIIMHFGLNMVSPSDQGYRAYCNKFRKGIDRFREAFPNTSLLIVSVSNRDQRGANGKFETMKGLTGLVKAQRQMAKDEHIAFWNLQQAMGGSGSTYRMQQAGQANRDYTHINFKGGAVLGKIFYDVLMNGKMNYEKRVGRKRH